MAKVKELKSLREEIESRILDAMERQENSIKLHERKAAAFEIKLLQDVLNASG